MLSPEEISSRRFLVSLRGYDRDEVHAFLAQVGEEVEALRARLTAAEDEAAQLRSSSPGQQAQDEAKRIVAEADARRRELEQAVAQLAVTRDRIAAELRQLTRSVERSLLDAAVGAGGQDPLRAALGDVVRRNVAAEDPDTAPAASAPDGSAPDALSPAAGPSPAADASPEATLVTGDPVPAEAVGFHPGARLAASPEEPEADPQHERAAALRERALAARHGELVAALRGALAPLHADVAGRLRASDGRGHAGDYLLAADAAAVLAAAGEPILQAVWRAGTANGRQLAHADATGPDDTTDAADAVTGLEPEDPLAEELAGAVADQLADALAHAVRIGLDAEEDVAALLARVDAVVAEVAGAPLSELAGLTLLRTYEEALHAAWQVGGCAQRRWALALEPPCTDPRCADNDRAGPVPLDEPFVSGHRLPPLRGGCNCTTVPVIPASEPAS